MKREKSFYYFLVMIMFIISFTTALILTCRTVTIGNLTPTASFIVYPITYFLAILFAERYGKEETKMMFNYAIFALIIMVLLITISSVLPVFGKVDGLEALFNMDYRIVFASIVSFYASQYLNLEIYYYISGFRGFKFLIAGVISSSIDSLLFIILAFVGALPFTSLIEKFTSQYVLNIFMIIVYTILFTYLVDTVIKVKHDEVIKEKEMIKKIEEEKAKEKEKPVKKPRAKKTVTKKSTKKEVK